MPGPSEVTKGFLVRIQDDALWKKAEKILTAKAEARQTPIDWTAVKWTPNSAYLPWKKPVTYNAGYVWLLRAFDGGPRGLWEFGRGGHSGRR